MLSRESGSALVDPFGRTITYLRVSVTDRCDFRCVYCMSENMTFLPKADLLSLEELDRLCSAFVEKGVRKLRLTGGEPLVRREFPRLVSMLARVDGISDLSLTTNGYLLERDAAALVDAGITRVNVSIDSLQRDRFFQLTRRDSLPKVLRGLEAIGAFPQVRPIKVNAVALRGFTEEEALPFAEFARSTSYQVRFIEFMPLDGDHAWSSDQVLAGEEIRAIIDRVHPLASDLFGILTRLGNEAGAEKVALMFNPSSPEWKLAIASGYRPLPTKFRFVGRTYDPENLPLERAATQWFVTLGDFDVI